MSKRIYKRRKNKSIIKSRLICQRAGMMSYKLIKYEQKWDIHTNICYIYHSDNIYIGSCTLQIMNDADYPMKILSLYIDDRYRNMGFGKMMLNEVVGDISDDCTLMVRKDNDKAIYMYRQVGFEFYSSEIDNDIEYIWMYRYKEKINQLLNEDSRKLE